MVASATSAVMILYTSFTATTSFMVFGLLEVSHRRRRPQQQQTLTCYRPRWRIVSPRFYERDGRPPPQWLSSRARIPEQFRAFCDFGRTHGDTLCKRGAVYTAVHAGFQVMSTAGDCAMLPPSLLTPHAE